MIDERTQTFLCEFSKASEQHVATYRRQFSARSGKPP